MDRKLLLALILHFTAGFAAAQAQPFRNPAPDQPLASSRVWSICQDHRGCLWFGCTGGLSRFNGQQFRNYTQNQGVDRNTVFAVAEDGENRLWIGTGRGPSLYDRAGDRFLPPAGATGPVVAFSRFKDGLCCLTANGLLGRLEKGQAWSFAALPGNRAGYTSLTSDETALFAASGEAVLRIENPSAPASGLRAIQTNTPTNALRCVPGTDYCWVATDNGLFQLDTRNSSLTGPLFDTRGERLTCLADDFRQGIWTGGAPGLRHIQGNTVERFDAGADLTGAPISAVFVDREGILWLGTLAGLRLGSAGKDGFGLVGGVGCVFPEMPPDTPPSAALPLVSLGRVLLTERGKSAQSLAEMNNATLPGDTHALRFDFDILKFRTPGSLTAMARLEGYDEDFIPLGEARTKEYTNLPPGPYAFWVRVAEKGRPPQDTCLATFRIPPSIWHNPLIYFVLAAFCVLLIHFIFRARYSTMQKENRRLQEAADQAARELEKKNSLLKHVAVTDELTGLFNRRFFLKALQQEFRRQARAVPGTEMSVLMVDVDHFKRVNDAFGHEVGDWVLQHIARCLRSSVRVTDIPARFGGEEFIILLPQTGMDGARRVGEKIRLLLMAFPAERDNLRIPCTVSVGVATSGGPLEYADNLGPDMIRRADDMLSRAKAAGRNRVMTEGKAALEQTLEIKRDNLPKE